MGKWNNFRYLNIAIMFKPKKSNHLSETCNWPIEYLKKLLYIFCKESNLHGCKHVVNRTEHRVFSVAWGIVLLTSLFFCAFLILIQLKRFQETTILNSIASTGYPAWKTQFPAVVICNNNIVYKSKAKHMRGMILSRGFQEKEVDHFFKHFHNFVACQHCDKSETYNSTIDVKIYAYLEELNYDVNTLMLELAQPCGKMIKQCSWKSGEKNCGQLFRRIKTTLGYCCAFNYFGTFEVQSDNYEKQLQYSGGFGLGSGLQIVVDVEPSQYVSSIKTTKGIQLLVGDVFQFAEMGLYSHSITEGQVLTMGLHPTIYGSHVDLRYISDESRGCWFKNEKKLRWSRIYNTLTCFNECKAALIYEICNCIPFYYSFTGVRRICTAGDLPCILNNESKFAQIMMSNDIEEDSEFIQKHGISNTKLCYCLPSCEEVDYEIDKNIKNVELQNNTCTIYIHFNTITGTYMLRNIYVTWDILLATIGGIFGLCMGGSILSVVELIFFVFNTCFKVKTQINDKNDIDNKIRNIRFVSKAYPGLDLKNQFLK